MTVDESTKVVTIEYFLKGKSLGKFTSDELYMSDQEMRIAFAKKQGIEDFDRFILDNGRVEAYRSRMPDWFTHENQLWFINKYHE